MIIESLNEFMKNFNKNEHFLSGGFKYKGYNNRDAEFNFTIYNFNQKVVDYLNLEVPNFTDNNNFDIIENYFKEYSKNNLEFIWRCYNFLGSMSLFNMDAMLDKFINTDNCKFEFTTSDKTPRFHFLGTYIKITFQYFINNCLNKNVEDHINRVKILGELKKRTNGGINKLIKNLSDEDKLLIELS